MQINGGLTLLVKTVKINIIDYLVILHCNKKKLTKLMMTVTVMVIVMMMMMMMMMIYSVFYLNNSIKYKIK